MDTFQWLLPRTINQKVIWSCCLSNKEFFRYESTNSWNQNYFSKIVHFRSCSTSLYRITCIFKFYSNFLNTLSRLLYLENLAVISLELFLSSLDFPILCLRYKSHFSTSSTSFSLIKFRTYTAWSVRIRSYSGLYFPAVGLNRDQNDSEYRHFLRSTVYPYFHTFVLVSRK